MLLEYGRAIRSSSVLPLGHKKALRRFRYGGHSSFSATLERRMADREGLCSPAHTVLFSELSPPKVRAVHSALPSSTQAVLVCKFPPPENLVF